MKKFIIDTDVGDDIDDAFAIDLALKLDLDLLAITTVFRNVRERAAIAKKLVALKGRSIPVYAGYGKTLSGDEYSARLCQWTPDLGSPRYLPDNETAEEAIDLILAAARTYGKDFYLLAIGPLTNVAHAILKDKEAMAGIGGIIMMGGDYVNHYAEWNIRCDLRAAEIVFSSDVPITAFGHEVTSQVRISEAEQEYVFGMEQDAYHAYLAELTRLWYLSKPQGYRIILHDLLVIRYAADPSYCETETAPVAVETKGEYTYSMTVNLTRMEQLHGVGKTIRFAKPIDVPEFIRYFMKGIGYVTEGGKECVRV
jgi:purine nucleosidase/pyrimidine-specific ribonucleoside hydrolase